MDAARTKKRPRRYCDHCDTELSHTQYFAHKKRYFRRGVWQKVNKFPSSVPSGQREDPENTGNLAEVEKTVHSLKTEVDLVEENDNIQPVTETHHGDQSIHQYMDSGDAVSEQEEADFCYDDEFVYEEGESLADVQSETSRHIQDEGYGEDQSNREKPQDLMMILNAISGVSCMMTNTMEDIIARINQRFDGLEVRLDVVEKDLESLQSSMSQSNSTEAEDTPKRRRVLNPKVAEAVRRLHNSGQSPFRYNPEEGLVSPHNLETTCRLREAISNSPEFREVDDDTITAACKTYFENVRRNYRFSQPEHAGKAEAAKLYARSRSRKKRLLDARRSVLRDGESEIFKSATVDLMSDEEDGIVNGVAGWIVRPPPSRSQELSELCAVLQARLEANPKYMESRHSRRLKE
ncbi:uncharacterized protein LOC134459833 isoform X2 [Engraulis encrasicolus]|uniref:uncharacterized protein LOC134459833 isoform X2 n=1 Tax=Engraulis encrasicolus TaxID=184585 RepID=UPI002FD643D6